MSGVLKLGGQFRLPTTIEIKPLLVDFSNPRANETFVESTGGDALISRLMQMIQKEYKWDTLDPPLSRQYGP
jgi:hypothetical protein